MPNNATIERFNKQFLTDHTQWLTWPTEEWGEPIIRTSESTLHADEIYGLSIGSDYFAYVILEAKQENGQWYVKIAPTGLNPDAAQK